VFVIHCVLSVGLSVDCFMTIMSLKMSAQDEDEHIRQMFLAFDMQCTCPLLLVLPSLSVFSTSGFSINEISCIGYFYKIV